jgi:hypothetical protein
VLTFGTACNPVVFSLCASPEGEKFPADGGSSLRDSCPPPRRIVGSGTVPPGKQMEFLLPRVLKRVPQELCHSLTHSEAQWQFNVSRSSSVSNSAFCEQCLCPQSFLSRGPLPPALTTSPGHPCDSAALGANLVQQHLWIVSILQGVYILSYTHLRCRNVT